MTVRNAMLALLLPLLAAAAPPAAKAPAENVAGLRLEARDGRTELTVEIAGSRAEWADFALSGPPRVVLDIHNATLALPGSRFEGLDRGGVRGVRTSQHTPSTVRVVLDLDRATSYRVERVAEGLRVSLASGATAFEPWSAGAPAPRYASASAPSARAHGRPPCRRAAAARTPDHGELREHRDARRARHLRGVLRPLHHRRDGRGEHPGGRRLVQQPAVGPGAAHPAPGVRARGRGDGGGIIRVDAIERLAARAAAEPVLTRSFRINYVPVGDLARTFEGMVTPSRGRIMSDTSSNTLIVTDVDRVVTDIAALIAQLDIPVPQVAIEAKIIFVDRTQLEALGIRYDLKDFRGNSFGNVVESPLYDPVTGQPTGGSTPENRFLLGGPSIGAVGNAASTIDNPTLDVAISLLLANRFSLVALVSALQQTRIADVQAMPQITTLSNRTARIFVGEEITFLTASAAGGAGGAVTLQPVQVDAGIELVVTPYVTADGRVRLSIRAENSNPTTTSNNLLNVSRQQGETDVLVSDGETVVIGGLTVTRLTESRAGIPFLMDLPLLGGLFRSTSREERKQDLLILVTPHIVRQPA
jgi:type IV pilus secretin PilQ/predicted competence protein